MPQKNDTDTPTYPEITPPTEFSSDIPAHLLATASPIDRYTMEQLSIARQSNAWCLQTLVKTHQEVVHTNGRLRKAEAEIISLKDDKKFWKRGWGFIVTVAGVIAGLVSFFILVASAFKPGS